MSAAGHDPAAGRHALRALQHDGELDLPDPASGRTAERLADLLHLSRTRPVGLARLAEAHVDAVSILHEAGREPWPGALYGVWASSGPTPAPCWSGGRLVGTKDFCSGLGIVDRALIVVDSADDGRPVLLDVDVRPGDAVTIRTEEWSTVALADTSTGSISFEHHPVTTDGRVADGSWYLDRPGFWHGACGPAACWAGAAIGVVDAAVALADDDPHRQAQLGAMCAQAWSLHTLFDGAGRAIDIDPFDRTNAEHRARSLRHVTERMCTDILDRFGRAFGPRPFTTQPGLAQRMADTQLYLRQHHGERELGAIAQLVEGPNTW